MTPIINKEDFLIAHEKNILHLLHYFTIPATHLSSTPHHEKKKKKKILLYKEHILNIGTFSRENQS